LLVSRIAEVALVEFELESSSATLMCALVVRSEIDFEVVKFPSIEASAVKTVRFSAVASY
jgi:hypothetical protein